MALPTQGQLDAEEQILSDRVVRLQSAYTHFLSEWEQIEQESTQVHRKISKLIDTTKIQEIASRIAQLPS